MSRKYLISFVLAALVAAAAVGVAASRAQGSTPLPSISPAALLAKVAAAAKSPTPVSGDVAWTNGLIPGSDLTSLLSGQGSAPTSLAGLRHGRLRTALGPAGQRRSPRGPGQRLRLRRGGRQERRLDLQLGDRHGGALLAAGRRGGSSPVAQPVGRRGRPARRDHHGTAALRLDRHGDRHRPADRGRPAELHADGHARRRDHHDVRLRCRSPSTAPPSCRCACRSSPRATPPRRCRPASRASPTPATTRACSASRRPPARPCSTRRCPPCQSPSGTDGDPAPAKHAPLTLAQAQAKAQVLRPHPGRTGQDGGSAVRRRHRHRRTRRPRRLGDPALRTRLRLRDPR